MNRVAASKKFDSYILNKIESFFTSLLKNSKTL